MNKNPIAPAARQSAFNPTMNIQRITERTRMKPISFLTLSLCAVLMACSPSPTPQQKQAEGEKAVLRKAEAMFQERCKTAGEKIHRTVDNVEGVFLMKLRPEKDNFSDQFVLDDPYGRDLSLASLVKGQYRSTHSGTAYPGSPPRLGYTYVEAIDPQDGKRYRYTGRIEEPWQYDKNYLKGYQRFVLDKTPATGPQPRYGVTYDDLSTREEREHWIAGSSLKVIDLQTNEVIAERIGYMMDPGQGSRGTGSGRSPWLMAADHACPSFQRNPNLPLPPGQGASAQLYQTLDFVEKVLRPKKDN